MTCVLLFPSIHYVMKAEKLLKGRKFPLDLVPVPREISSDCGVAIEIPLETEKEVRCLIHDHGLTCVECYHRGDRGEYFKAT